MTAYSGWLAELPAKCSVLRGYQLDQLRGVHDAFLQGHRRVLNQLPTGGGKTHEIAAVTLAAEQAGLRVMIVATRTRLIRQIHERLDDFLVQHGVIAAPLKDLVNLTQRVQVASADTLYRRCISDERAPLPAADVVIFDEAHLALASTRVAILERYQDAVLIGFTATPARRSGKPLRELFDVLLLGPSVEQLIDAGQLVRPRIFNVPVVSKAELDDLPKDMSRDYQAKDLGEVMSRPKLIGDVVLNWLRIAAGKRTLVFASNKGHAQSLVEAFSRSAVAAELLTDDDDEDTREAVLERLQTGQTTILVNCFLMSYGVDVPSVEAIVIARPTRSVVLYLQCVGRGLRPAPGKESCIVIDHGHVVENLGMPTDPFNWTLDPESNVNAAAASRQRASSDEQPRTCPECNYFWLVSEEGARCSSCGWEPKAKPKPVATADALLTEFGAAPHDVRPWSPEVAKFFAESLYWYRRRWPDRWLETPKKGRWWAWIKTSERFKFAADARMPTGFWEMQEAQSVSAATAGWLKAAGIRWVKSQAYG